MHKDIEPAVNSKSEHALDASKECPANAAAAHCLEEVHQLRRQSSPDVKPQAAEASTHKSVSAEEPYLHKMEITDANSTASPKQDNSTERASANTRHATKSTEPSWWVATPERMERIDQRLEKALVGH